MLGNRFGKQKQSEYYCKRDIQQNRCITQVMRVTEEKMQIKKYNVPLRITNIFLKKIPHTGDKASLNRCG